MTLLRSMARSFFARLLLAKPAAWRVLEGVIALVMWAIAGKLIASV